MLRGGESIEVAFELEFKEREVATIQRVAGKWSRQKEMQVQRP